MEGGCIIFHIIINNKNIFYNYLLGFLYYQNVRIYVDNDQSKNQRTSSKRLLNICKKLGADTYISGIGGKRYLDEKSFEKNKIILKYQNYNPIRYPQRMSKSFIPNLSILDLLANVGSESGKLLKESN